MDVPMLRRTRVGLMLAVTLMGAGHLQPAAAQAWRNCIPGSMGPGGCDSMGPGGGQSMGPGGGLSMGPGGGLSMGQGGGLSMGPGGGLSMGPGGGQAINRDTSRGLDPDWLQRGIARPYPSTTRMPTYGGSSYDDD